LKVAILKLSDAFGRIRASRSAGYRDIANGLLPTPVQVSARAVGIPSREIDAIEKAIISGATVEQRRALVQKLLAQRAVTE
jgi:predicted DNA-binding transcriptional regulator AlpA